MVIIRILDRTGHTETALDTEAAIARLEQEMNTAPGRHVLMAQPTGTEDTVVLREPSDLRRYEQDMTAWLMPRMVGG